MMILQLLLLGLSASIVSAGEWVYPIDCTSDNSCIYKATWTEEENDVRFEIVAKQPVTTWTGIGMTKEHKIKDAELIYGYVDDKGNSVVIDGTYLDEYTPPMKDVDQNLTDANASYKDDHLTLSFTHMRISHESHEFNLTDKDCYYFIFPVEGGSIVDNHGAINKPYKTPMISTNLICFNETEVSVTGSTTHDDLTNMSTVTMHPLELEVSVTGSTTHDDLTMSTVTRHPLELEVSVTGSTTHDDLTMSTVTMHPLELEDIFTMSSGELDETRGKWVYPAACESNSSCVYKVEWELDTKEDVIKFEIEAKQPPKTWTAIAFTDDPNMNSADVIYGYINNTGEGVVLDGWIPTQVSGPQKDLEQNLTDSSIEYKDGVLKMNFTRPRHLTDLRDLSFTDDDCHYFVYPIGGGDVSDDGTLKTHHVMPIVSKRKICVRDRDMLVTRTSMLPTTLSHDDDGAEIERTLSWMEPKDCEKTKTCLYKMWYSINKEQDLITINVEAKQDVRTWTGIGFAMYHDVAMGYGGDFYYGYLTKDGKQIVNNGWIEDIDSKPEKDDVQNLVNPRLGSNDGYLRMSFSRKRSNPKFHDLGLTDNDCLYFVLPVGGGPILDDDSDVGVPFRIPKITRTKVCLNEDNVTLSTSLPLVEQTLSTQSPLDIKDKDNVTLSTSLPLVEQTLSTQSPLDIKDKELKRVVYYSNWSQHRQGKAKFLPENLDPSLCTHLAYAWANISVDHKLIPTETNEDTPGGLYERFNNLKNKKPDVKTILSAGGWANVSTMLKTEDTRKAFIDSSIEVARKFGFDGLELHFLYQGCPDSLPEDKLHLTSLVKEMCTAFDNEAKTTGKVRLLLTLAVHADKQILDNGYEFDKIQKDLDFIDFLTYNLHDEESGVTGHPSPLFPGKGLNPSDAQTNVDWLAKYLVSKGVPKNKINIGMATYGTGYTLKDPNNHGLGAPVTGPSPAGEYTVEPGMLAYYEICQQINSSSTTTVLLTDEKVPYLYNGTTWVGYEDPTSMAVKVKWLKESGFGGWVVSIADTDDFTGDFCNQGPYPLISSLSKTLVGSSVTVTGTPLTKILQSTTELTHKTETETEMETETVTVGHKMSTLPEPIID